MKKIMVVAMLFVAAVAFAGPASSQASPSLYNTKWFLEKIHQDNKTESVLVKKAFIRFDEEKKSGGGNGGCNSFGSSVSVTNDSISITHIFSTKMFCEAFQQAETSFFNLLGKANKYVIKDKGLQLYQDDTLLLEFSAE